MRLNNYCPNLSIETIFTFMENSKMHEPNKFVLNLSRRLDKEVQINMLLFKTYLFITGGII